jgi:hypothetical protein
MIISSSVHFRVRAHAVTRRAAKHHWYTKSGHRRWERLTQPDDITTAGGYLFTGFQNGVGPQGQASTDGNRDGRPHR